MYRNHNKCLKAVEFCEVQPVRCTGAILLLLSFVVVQWVTCFRDLLIIVFVLVANAQSLRKILWVVADQMDRICCFIDYDCVDTCFMLFWWIEPDNSADWGGVSAMKTDNYFAAYVYIFTPIYILGGIPGLHVSQPRIPGLRKGIRNCNP